MFARAIARAASGSRSPRSMSERKRRKQGVLRGANHVDLSPELATLHARPMSEATLERLGAAQKLIAKWCQPGALALPDIKARLRTLQCFFC